MNEFYRIPQYSNYYRGSKDEERVGFLLPFVAGAAISAPFWFAAGLNRPQYNQCCPPQYPYPFPQQYPQIPTYAPVYSPIYIRPPRPRPYYRPGY